MINWNIVICVYQDGFKRAVRALQRLGRVERSPYHNVLVMSAEDPMATLEAIERQAEQIPALYDAISRVSPFTQTFEFQSAEEFRDKARERVIDWLPRLAGRSFHVRFHRRGLRGDLRSPEVERFLDDVLLDALKQAGTPGTISFSDPGAVIAIETIDNRAGLALWSREELARHRLVRPD